MKVYEEGTDSNKKEKESFLTELNEGEKVTTKDIKPNQHFNQQPLHYTEATLVGTKQKQGLDRPSTYASTLETIQRRCYVKLDNRWFVPTELGEIVVDVLVEYFPEITNVDFTADMEGKLDLIEEGQKEWIKIIDDFYQDFR